jgi:hypothetical protein
MSPDSSRPIFLITTFPDFSVGAAVAMADSFGAGTATPVMTPTR